MLQDLCTGVILEQPFPRFSFSDRDGSNDGVVESAVMMVMVVVVAMMLVVVVMVVLLIGTIALQYHRESQLHYLKGS